MTLTDSLAAWWHAREPREQRMLAVMVVAVAAFVSWFGIIGPLERAGTAARAHHERAAADHAEVSAAVMTFQTRQAQYPPLDGGQAFAEAILTTAEAHRVPVSRQRHDAGGTFVVGIDAVEALALLQWLDALRQRYGLAPETLDVGKRNGALHAEIAFKPLAS